MNPADDSGRYMVLGESLAKTGELRLINDERQLRDTLYVPGFPAIIAFWLKVTHQPPGGVVLLVKFTQLLFLLGTLPLFYQLLARSKLSKTYITAGMLIYATCPALIAYANEIMSEMPLLLLILATTVLVERDARLKAEEDKVPIWKKALALLCAGISYYIRAAGVILLASISVWFWKRFGWKWGAAATCVMLLVVGTWTMRNNKIIAQDPPNSHDTYMKQFTLRDPDKPDAGRIKLNAIGLLGKARRGFPVYIGMIPRAVMYVMPIQNSPWLVLFFLIAIPFTMLVLLGLYSAILKGQLFTVGFSALFWLFVAMWPWKNARFLVPVIPIILLCLLLGVEYVTTKLIPNALHYPQTGRMMTIVWGTGFALLMIHFLLVYIRIVPQEHRGTLPGYRLGRTRDEAGFYAACEWLKQREPESVVMGRPAYHLHLYTGHPTTQVEPTENPRVQEKAYFVPHHVRYLVMDIWPWAKTRRYLAPYLKEYGADWKLAWKDPNGSGVEVYQRK